MPNSKRKVRNFTKAGNMVSTGGELLRKMFAIGPEKFRRAFESKMEKGSLVLTYPNGARQFIKGRKKGPNAEIDVVRWRAMQRLLLGGTVGGAKSFILGEWTSPDLVAVVELFAVNQKTFEQGFRPTRWVKNLNRLKHKFQANTKKGSRKNTQFHYDLGNDFYQAWLDPSMTYSAAIFEKGDNSLEVAQKRKYRKLLNLLEVKPGQKILEIGCGWGGFAETAALEFDVSVTGITLSREQLKYAKDRMQKAGLEDKVSIRFEDYRDINETFDHVVSIEMFEAVGEDYWQAYFSKIKQVLKPGGTAALQIITIDNDVFETYRKDVDFIQTYIFPGGMLPSINALQDQVAKAGLIWGKARPYGAHYAKTLKEWRKRFERAYKGGRLPEGFDEAFRRTWNYYLAYCEGGFRGEIINVVQLQLMKNKI
ncbi:MAG: class I SAM-dependent methyltransferase [Alphaproteobacteria bacterium]